MIARLLKRIFGNGFSFYSHKEEQLFLLDLETKKDRSAFKIHSLY